MRAYLSVFTVLCLCIAYVLQTVTFTEFGALQLGMKKALKQKLQGLKEFSSDEAAYALEKLISINQKSALRGVRGNGIASRTLPTPVMYTIKRSKPKPKPECGTEP